jgi:hypothetical protein
MTTIPIDSLTSIEKKMDGQRADLASMPLAESDKMRLWMTLIIGVLVVALASIAAAVTLVVMGKPDLAAAAWPIATASVAGIVGLFAKSPTSN